jgi:hypothetical protein
MSVSRDEKGTVRPTLILLGLRLGIDRITAVYWNGLKAVLQLPQSVGIAGYVMQTWSITGVYQLLKAVEQRTSVSFSLFCSCPGFAFLLP